MTSNALPHENLNFKECNRNFDQESYLVTIDNKTEGQKYDDKWYNDRCNDRIHEAHQEIKLQLRQCLV